MEELSPYKELFTTVVPENGLIAALLHLAFVFSPAANRDMDVRILMPK